MALARAQAICRQTGPCLRRTPPIARSGRRLARFRRVFARMARSSPANKLSPRPQQTRHSQCAFTPPSSEKVHKAVLQPRPKRAVHEDEPEAGARPGSAPEARSCLLAKHDCPALACRAAVRGTDCIECRFCTVPNHSTRVRAQARRGARSATWRQQSRPWRVIPLALFAVAATTASMGVARHLFWQASHHRYADDILRNDLHRIHVGSFLSLR